MRRLALLTAMALVTTNIWTGGPLLALWIGSRLQPSAGPSMLAVVAVIVSLGIVSFLLVRALALLDARYGEAEGRTVTVRRHVPWLRSMRGERPHAQRRFAELAPLERMLVATVVVVVLLFEAWFFFYSGSPIDQRSGRSHDAPLIG